MSSSDMQTQPQVNSNKFALVSPILHLMTFSDLVCAQKTKQKNCLFLHLLSIFESSMLTFGFEEKEERAACRIFKNVWHCLSPEHVSSTHNMLRVRFISNQCLFPRAFQKLLAVGPQAVNKFVYVGRTELQSEAFLSTKSSGVSRAEDGQQASDKFETTLLICI